MIQYAITDPSFFNTSQNRISYINSICNRVDFVLFRDKETTNYKDAAKEFMQLSKNCTFKKIIHRDYNLARELGAYGVHLTSTQFKSIKLAKELGLWVVISTHTLDEIKMAQDLGANAVTFSPIFDTPNKGKAKGVKALKEAIECCNIDIIALGGIITDEHIKLIKEIKAFGFASIRYFTNN